MGRVIVFDAKVNTKANGSENLAARARDAGTAAAKAAAASKAAQAAAAAAQTAAHTAAQTAQTAAQAAAQGMNTAAQTAATGVGRGVKEGVYYARGWAAPVLENAADYTTATLAPKVSAALRDTARQVRPEDTSRNKLRSALTWSALGAAVLAALGAAAVVVKKRYQSAMAAEAEADATNPTANPAASENPSGTAQTDAAGTASPDGGVDGRVSTSGW
jgi:trimeric autotransporter adhesin